MNIYFTFWHYGAIVLSLILFILFSLLAFYAKRLWAQLLIILSSLFFSVSLLVLMFTGLEKTTKKAEIYNLRYNRLLQTEQIVFIGTVKNTGEYHLNTVELQLIIENAPKPGTGIFGGAPHAFNEALDSKYLPQKLTYNYTIATDIEPKASKQFTLLIDYPPYFNNGSYTTKAIGH
ncbi:MAG: DUF2393 family protein [Sulfuricurvum sp.]|uniref:DUF2393 family protein n=1 Tax=Sulfuricurvum sp. TaxID=2025608 RepID=UPI002630212A|nr:DUF2393 family protein [Sulfuricurvum sp.]MDD5158832.1 DUF2393 family protein [Sulfuricurvum sp.]